jgi:hypothetical protein
MSMADRIHLNEESRVHPGELGHGEFGHEVRRLALDAHRILRRPDSSLDDLIDLHGRVFHLLRQERGARSGGIGRWLLAVRQEIGVKLESWSVEDLESCVA